MNNWLIVLTASILLSGCSTKLHVFDDKNSKTGINGIPFQLSQPYVKEYTRDVHTKGGKCEPNQVQELIHVGTKKRYYLNIDPKTFADASISMKYHENGYIQEILMNTKPDNSAIDSATTALSTLLPFVGALPKVAAPAATPVDDSTSPALQNPVPPRAAATVKKACDTGQANVIYKPFKSVVNDSDE